MQKKHEKVILIIIFFYHKSFYDFTDLFQTIYVYKQVAAQEMNMKKCYINCVRSRLRDINNEYSAAL
jgi:hypothetical protein